MGFNPQKCCHIFGNWYQVCSPYGELKIMQSDAFPTPPVYGYLFQPRLIQPFTSFDSALEFAPESANDNHDSDRYIAKLQSCEPTAPDADDWALNDLLGDIETLIADCSSEESQLFWSATECLKLKHQVIESMQKIETLFLDLAKTSTQDPNLIAALSEGLLYTSASQRSHSLVPHFLRER